MKINEETDPLDETIEITKREFYNLSGHIYAASAAAIVPTPKPHDASYFLEQARKIIEKLQDQYKLGLKYQ